MIFNSPEFGIFALIVFPVYAVLRGKPLRFWLVVMSYIFYGWANPWYILLLLGSTVLDFNIGKRMSRTDDARRRKMLLAMSLIGNLGALGIFKYSGFVIRSINDIAATIGVAFPVEPPDILLPIGISFYTFQTLSYTIDIYRGQLEPTDSFSAFALYVAFFPQLVAGPIERATHLLHQLEEKQPTTTDDLITGITRVLWGLTKKIVFADYLGIYVATVYDGGASNLDYLLATYAFAFQIYLDFSGYSDIAIGLARIMGIDLRENFLWPYLSRNISEFWQRWHISLSTWLRDYLYIPLGGSRKGSARTAANVVIVMFLGGLWHGADLKFAIWGLWLGLALGVYHIYALIFKKKFNLDDSLRWRDVIGIFITLQTVMISWVFFRADSTTRAFNILENFVTRDLRNWTRLRALNEEEALLVVVLMVITFGLHIFHRLQQGRAFLKWRHPVLVGAFWGGLILFMFMFHAPTGERFIYFQF